jgi:hypothetical protein
MMISQGRKGIDREKDMLRIEREMKPVDSETIENREARETGAEWCCHQALAQLGMASFLRRQGRDKDSVRRAPALLIIRTVYHSSENKSLRIMQETSSVCELSGIPVSDFNRHSVYNMPLSFYKPETRLLDRTSRLFNLQDRIVLFDLTDSHFEGRREGSRPARFGRSREKRSDARPVVLAPVVNTKENPERITGKG